MTSKSKRFSTKAVHAGEKWDSATKAAITPIYETSIFGFSSTQELIDIMTRKAAGYVYTRYGNPTWRAAENKMAELEVAEDASVFSSGMAAIATTIFTLISSRDHIISARDVYGGTLALFKDVLPKFGVEVSLVEATDLREMKSAIKENTKAIFVETPTNPTLKIVDIPKVADFARKSGTKVVVDNTFASPYNQRPIELGADIVIHSATTVSYTHLTLPTKRIV